MSDTKWKNLGGKINEKEGFTDKPLSPLQFPSNYPLSESSTNNDTIKRIKKIKKTRIHNPKNIPLLENIYESEENGSGSVFSSPENIFTHFFESPQTIKEGLALPGNLKLKSSPGSDPNESASDKLSAYSKKKIDLVKGNLTLTQKAYADKMTETRAQIDKLKHNIFNIDKMSTDFSEDINAKAPSSPDDKNMMKQGSQDAQKEASEALKRIGFVVKLMIQKLIKWTNLGIAKFKLQMYKFVLRYKEIVASIAQALTGYTLLPDGSKKYYVTETEINIFSKEIVRFITILMSWIFLYNWYYLMFFLKPEQQFKLNLNNWYEKHSMVYSILGPPLRAVENIDWFILEFLPRIRYLVPSKGLLFFIMSIVFIILVQKGKQWTIMNDFFNAINKSYTTSLINAFVIGCIVVYGFSFAGYFASVHDFALVKTWYTALLWMIFTVVYLLCIITLGVPIGMLSVCGFFFFYSFFAIVIYNGFTIGPVLKAISEQITNISAVNFDESNMTWTQWAYTTLQKFVKYFLYFMFEIFVLYILIGGLVNYIKGYNVPLAEKATLKNVFSTSGAFKEAFHHLYTWLIIINVLLIVLIFTIMKIRYDAIKHLAPNQPFNDDTGETMFQRLMNVGSITKNAVLDKYNQASGLKNNLSQNTVLGKVRLPFSGKAGALSSGMGGLMGKGGVPDVGSLMNAASKVDAKTISAVSSAATDGVNIVSNNATLKDAAVGALNGEKVGPLNILSNKEAMKGVQSLATVGTGALETISQDKAALGLVSNASGQNIGTIQTGAQIANKLAPSANAALNDEKLIGQVASLASAVNNQK